MTNVLETIAEQEGVDVLDLPPIYDVVDPDALGALLDSADETVTVHFVYNGYDVTVSSDGRVAVDAND